jgi:hypothetical protein
MPYYIDPNEAPERALMRTLQGTADGRFAPRGYEPARMEPPPAMLPIPDYMNQDFDIGYTGLSGAGVESPEYAQTTSATRRNQDNLRRMAGTVQPVADAMAPSMWETFRKEGLHGVWARNRAENPDAAYILPGGVDVRQMPTKERTPKAPKKPTASATPPSAIAQLGTDTPAAPAPAPAADAPQGPRPTNIPGIYERVGRQGEREFYNIPGERQQADAGAQFQMPREAMQMMREAEWARINARGLMDDASQYPGTPYARRKEMQAQQLLAAADERMAFASQIAQQGGLVQANQSRGQGQGNSIYDIARAEEIAANMMQSKYEPPASVLQILELGKTNPRDASAQAVTRQIMAVNLVASRFPQLRNWNEVIAMGNDPDFAEQSPDLAAALRGVQGFSKGGFVDRNPQYGDLTSNLPSAPPPANMTGELLGQASAIRAAQVADQERAFINKMRNYQWQRMKQADHLKNMERINKDSKLRGRGAAAVGSRGGGGGGGESRYDKAGRDDNSRASVAARNFAAAAGSGSGGGAVSGNQGSGGSSTGGSMAGSGGQSISVAPLGGMWMGDQQSGMSNYRSEGNKNAKKNAGASYGSATKMALGGLVGRGGSSSRSSGSRGGFPSLLSAMGGIFKEKEDRMGFETDRDRELHNWDKSFWDKEGQARNAGLDNAMWQMQFNQDTTQSRENRDRQFWGMEDNLRRQNLSDSLRPVYGRTGFADGGYVDMPDDVMLGLDGGMGGMEGAPGGAMAMLGGAPGMDFGGDFGVDPMQDEYQQYAQQAQQLGLPVIPFEEYAAMMQQSGGMGGGDMGGDPAVGGKMVVDPDPNAPTDSIPAMIDGEQPAQLDSGEFVFPRHAVLFHGIDKLKKLIAQSEAQG